MGPYTLRKVLGSGRFGMVFLGETEPPAPENRAALKIPRHFEEAGESIDDEIRILQDLQGCNHIVRVANVLKAKERPILALELLDVNLYEVLREYRRSEQSLPLPRVKQYIRHMLRGLAWMHVRQYSHSDLKPENLLLDRATDTLKLCDVGHARKFTTQSPTFAQPPQTTHNYRAIEVLLHLGPYSIKTDMWAAGCTAYEILTKDVLFDPDVDMYGDTASSCDGESQDGHDEGEIEEDEEEEDEEEEDEEGEGDGEEEEEEPVWKSESSDEDSDDEFESEIIHIEQVMSVFGTLPKSMRQTCRRHFNAKGFLRDRGNCPVERYSIAERLVSEHAIERSQAQPFEDFVLQMCFYNMKKRKSCSVMLEHPWLA